MRVKNKLTCHSTLFQTVSADKNASGGHSAPAATNLFSTEPVTHHQHLGGSVTTLTGNQVHQAVTAPKDHLQGVDEDHAVLPSYADMRRRSAALQPALPESIHVTAGQLHLLASVFAVYSPRWVGSKCTAVASLADKHAWLGRHSYSHPIHILFG